MYVYLCIGIELDGLQFGKINFRQYPIPKKKIISLYDPNIKIHS